MLSRKRVESEECDELRARLQKNKLHRTLVKRFLLLKVTDSQQGDDMVGQTASEEMYLSSVEEESGDSHCQE